MSCERVIGGVGIERVWSWDVVVGDACPWQVAGHSPEQWCYGNGSVRMGVFSFPLAGDRGPGYARRGLHAVWVVRTHEDGKSSSSSTPNSGSRSSDEEWLDNALGGEGEDAERDTPCEPPSILRAAAVMWLAWSLGQTELDSRTASAGVPEGN